MVNEVAVEYESNFCAVLGPTETLLLIEPVFLTMFYFKRSD